MDTDLLQRIRQERRRRGWSMRAAASAAGVSNTTWSRVEAGAVPITPQMSRAIAIAFQWPADWESLPPETVGQPASTVDPDELLERIRAELEASERRIEQMIERMTGAKDNDRTNPLGESAEERGER